MQLTLFALTFATLAIAGPINPYEVRTAIKSTPSMSYGQGIDILTTPTAVVVKREEAIEPPQADAKGYNALAVASKNLNTDHRPDFTNTEPAANIGPFPQWADPKKIVAMDPLGHLAPWLFKDIIQNEDVDIRPTIAITKAHMKLPELEESVRN
ncbi:hypothetical protein D6D25_08907, partial [Aureobasidium pullulans]